MCLEASFTPFNLVTPILHQQQNYHHVDSVKFEILHPPEKKLFKMQRLSVEEANGNKPVEREMETENQTIVQIKELEPGIQYSLKATAHYPNNQSVPITETFEIPEEGNCVRILFLVLLQVKGIENLGGVNAI